MSLTDADVRLIQRRTLSLLDVSQALGGLAAWQDAPDGDPSHAG